MNICVVTLYTKEIEHWSKYGLINKKLYCRNRYDFRSFSKSLDKNRPPTWSKLIAIERILSQYDWIFWTDADSLIMNKNILLEQFIDKKFNFIVGSDHNGVNTGHFFIKNCEWSFDLLHRCYEQKQFINVKSEMCDEQGAFRHLCDTNPKVKSKVKILSQRKLNSYRPGHAETGGEYEFGDFIIHFSQRHLDRKPLMFSYFVNQTLML